MPKLEKFILKFFCLGRFWQGSYQEEISSLNFFQSLMKLMEDFIMLRFISVVKSVLPNKKIWLVSFSLIFRISKLLVPGLSKRTVCRLGKNFYT